MTHQQFSEYLDREILRLNNLFSPASPKLKYLTGRIEALEAIKRECLPFEQPDPWIRTADGFPKKQGGKVYEQIPCLAVKKKTGYPEILVWNCTEECWDDADGDDYECDALDVTHYMLLPAAPSPVTNK